MLTHKDISQLKKIFVTKEEFNGSLVSFKDQILGEVKAMREELAVVIGYKTSIEDHEGRLEEHRQMLVYQQEQLVRSQRERQEMRAMIEKIRQELQLPGQFT